MSALLQGDGDAAETSDESALGCTVCCCTLRYCSVLSTINWQYRFSWALQLCAVYEQGLEQICLHLRLVAKWDSKHLIFWWVIKLSQMGNVSSTLVQRYNCSVEQLEILNYFRTFVNGYGLTFLTTKAVEAVSNVMFSDVFHEMSAVSYRRYVQVREVRLSYLDLLDDMKELNKGFHPVRAWLWLPYKTGYL